ncbi:hypothetical protein EBZ38_12290 [bacterium]|nr:hypothetical protein [bacterium]NDD85035.1 hypothetical protein [bacterium]
MANCQNGRFRPQTAKMADVANLVPEQILCHKKLFSTDFFCLTFKEPLVEYRYKGKKEKR